MISLDFFGHDNTINGEIYFDDTKKDLIVKIHKGGKLIFSTPDTRDCLSAREKVIAF